MHRISPVDTGYSELMCIIRSLERLIYPRSTASMRKRQPHDAFASYGCPPLGKLLYQGSLGGIPRTIFQSADIRLLDAGNLSQLLLCQITPLPPLNDCPDDLPFRLQCFLFRLKRWIFQLFIQCLPEILTHQSALPGLVVGAVTLCAVNRD